MKASRLKIIEHIQEFLNDTTEIEIIFSNFGGLLKPPFFRRNFYPAAKTVFAGGGALDIDAYGVANKPEFGLAILAA